MPRSRRIVINTGPILALVAGLSDLKILATLYDEVHVPAEVEQEVLAGGKSGLGVQQFNDASWLEKWRTEQSITPLLANSLDRGEASVIQLALSEQIRTVCIDEAVGRRVARLCGLNLTGSIGILLRAKQEGLLDNVGEVLQQMRNKGIWISDRVLSFALQKAEEEGEQFLD